MAKVMIVDDEPDIREMINLILSKNGYTTEMAVDGDEFLHKVDTFHPDLVTLDVMMPGPMTREILDKLHSIPKNMDSLIMMITIIVFILLVVITFIGLILTMQNHTPEFYETRLAPVIVLLLIVLSLCLAWRWFTKENIGYIIIWVLMAAVACAVTLPGRLFPGDAETFYGSSISTHHIVGFLIPFVFIVHGCLFYTSITV